MLSRQHSLLLMLMAIGWFIAIGWGWTASVAHAAPLAQSTITPAVTPAATSTRTGDEPRDKLPTVTPTPAFQAEETNTLSDTLSDVVVRFSGNEEAYTGDFTLFAGDLPAAPEGTHFELWLQQASGEFLDLGNVVVNESSNAYSGSTDQELLATYESALISVEADGRESPEPSRVVYSGTLPAQLTPFLRLLYFGEQFVGTGTIPGAMTEAQVARIHSRFLLDALVEGEVAESRRYVEHILNVLQGTTGDLYGDLNRDGLIQNPGDGFGLAPYLTELETQVTALERAIGNQPASSEMRELVEEIQVAVGTAQTLSATAAEQASAVFDADSAEVGQPLAAELLATTQELEVVTEEMFVNGLELATIDLVIVGSLPAPVAIPIPTESASAGDDAAGTTSPITTTAPTSDNSPGAAGESSRPLPSLAGQAWVNPADGAEYVYVPGGVFAMGADEAAGVPEAEQPQHLVTTVGFWLKRTEVTNAQYARCVAEGVCTPPDNDSWDAPELAQHPVTDVDWQQARTYATWVGGRLPTEAEWEKGCRSSDGRTFPWGDQPATDELANFGNNVGTTTEVGSYADGISPYGTLDMSGNVWEWTSSLEAEYPYLDDDGREEVEAEGKRLARGGSFYYTHYQLPCTSRFALQPTTANDQVGFRVVMPAEAVYWVNPADGAEYVYVPAGAFTMGADEESDAPAAEQPQHLVTTNAFWLQRTEVTNAQYARCVEDGTCTPPDNDSWDTPDLAQHPVTDVDWQQANTYAAWVDGHLPTEAEWEKGCRSNDGRIFPWGDQPATDELANFGNNVGATTEVGSYLDGISPYGTLDMSGNVWEWTSSLEVEYPYLISDGREDSDAEGKRVARGGSFYYTHYQLPCTSRFALQPATANDQVGFRVAYAPR